MVHWEEELVLQNEECPFIFPKESLAEVSLNLLSGWKSPPGPLPPGQAAPLPSVWAVSLPSFYGQASWHPAAVPQSTPWEQGLLLYARSLEGLPAWQGKGSCRGAGLGGAGPRVVSAVGEGTCPPGR